MEKQINEKKALVQKGCFFYRFLVLRLHKKALIPRLFPVDLDAP